MDRNQEREIDRESSEHSTPVPTGMSDTTSNNREIKQQGKQVSMAPSFQPWKMQRIANLDFISERQRCARNDQGAEPRQHPRMQDSPLPRLHGVQAYGAVNPS